MGLIHDQYMSWLKLGVENERLKARIAELESRPGPPAPAATDPDTPRRFRYRYIHEGTWIYGVHYPEGCQWTARNLATIGTTRAKIFEWIDEPPGERGDE